MKLKNVSRSKDDMKKVIALAIALLLSNSVMAESTIGPHRDGVSYEILSSKKITKPDVINCGRNDMGLPIQGIYEQQTRSYTEWKNNKPVKRWTEKKDIFQRCHQV